MAIFKIQYDNHNRNVRSATSNFRIALARIITSFPECYYAEIEDSTHDVFVTAVESCRTCTPNTPIEVLTFNGSTSPSPSYYEVYNSAFANAIYDLMIPEVMFVKVFYPIPATTKMIEITMCSYNRHVYEEEGV